jgi:acyl-CoA synthetase (AMP-forming)/AMP-acid ligase II
MIYPMSDLCAGGSRGLVHDRLPSQRNPAPPCVAAASVTLRPEREPNKESILNFLSARIVKWWMPGDVVFVDSMPHTATGKLLKTETCQVSRTSGGERLRSRNLLRKSSLAF